MSALRPDVLLCSCIALASGLDDLHEGMELFLTTLHAAFGRVVLNGKPSFGFLQFLHEVVRVEVHLDVRLRDVKRRLGLWNV